MSLLALSLRIRNKLLTYIMSLFFLHGDRLFTFWRKWTRTVMDGSLRQRFWKIKKHFWTAKWQTTADSCIYRTMNCSRTLWPFMYCFFFFCYYLWLRNSIVINFPLLALWCQVTKVSPYVFTNGLRYRMSFQNNGNLDCNKSKSPFNWPQNNTSHCSYRGNLY